MKTPRVRTMSESTWQVGNIGRPLESDASGCLHAERKRSWQNRKMNKNDPASTDGRIDRRFLRRISACPGQVRQGSTKKQMK